MAQILKKYQKDLIKSVGNNNFALILMNQLKVSDMNYKIKIYNLQIKQVCLK